MSKAYSADKTNRTPWSDVITLIREEKREDEAGFDKVDPPRRREIFCTFTEGASRAEYYEAMKAGVRISATVEVWEDDFEGERQLEHSGVRYEIGRTWPTGRGTLILYLTEVWR